MEPTVSDAPERSRHELRDGDRLLGVAAYQRHGDQVVFSHTEVEDSEEHPGPDRAAPAVPRPRRHLVER